MATTLIFPTKAELVDAAADQLIGAIADAIGARGVALVVLTGGSNGIALLETLRERHAEIDWTKVELFFGDERFVPADDAERNVRQAAAALFDHVAIDPARVHAMAPSDGAFGDDIDAAAAAYAAELAEVSSGEPSPQFDVHLLGMGGEGHINSLFPHTAATAETARTVVSVERTPRSRRRAGSRSPCRPSTGRARCGSWWPARTKPTPSRRASPGRRRPDWPCASAHGTEDTVWFLDSAAADQLS